MLLQGVQIITPNECQALYSQSWRHETAKCLNDSKAGIRSLPMGVRRDSLVRNQLKYLSSGGAAPISSRQVFDIVNTVYDRTVGNLRCWLEALFLTKVSLEAIAADTGLSLEAVILYEKVFYNVRGADGNIPAPVGRRMNFALDGMLEINKDSPPDALWRMYAVRYGAGALAREWGWTGSRCGAEDTEGIPFERALEESLAPALLKRVHFGQVENKSLVDLTAAILSGKVKMEEVRIKWEEVKIAQMKEEREQGKKGAINELGVISDMLHPFQPKRIEVQYNDDDKAEINRKLAEKAKAGVKVGSSISKVDKAEAMASLDAELQERIKEQK